MQENYPLVSPGMPAQQYETESVYSEESTDHILEDDSVSLGLKRISNGFTIAATLWLISYILIMVQMIDDGQFVSYTWLLFAPMWAGSFIGAFGVVVILIRICRNGVMLVSRERRLFMRVQGLRAGEEYVDYESLPLMRILFLWSSVLAFGMLVILTTQILFYLWYILGIIGMWHAFIPVISFAAIALIFMYLVHCVSIFDCINLSLLFSSVLLFAAKCRGETVHILAMNIPMVLVQVSWFFHLASLGWRSLRGLLRMTCLQWLCLIGYEVAIALSSAAVYLSTMQNLENPMGTLLSDDKTIVFLWLVAGICFVLSYLSISHIEMYKLAESRGFCNPRPLARTRTGWNPLPDRPYIRSVLMGSISAGPPPLSLLRWISKSTVEDATSFSSNHGTGNLQMLDSSTAAKQVERNLSGDICE